MRIFGVNSVAPVKKIKQTVKSLAIALPMLAMTESCGLEIYNPSYPYAPPPRHYSLPPMTPPPPRHNHANPPRQHNHQPPHGPNGMQKRHQTPPPPKHHAGNIEQTQQENIALKSIYA